MNIEEIKATRRKEREQEAEMAGIFVSRMGLPKEIESPEEIYGLGGKLSKVYSKTREKLLEDFGQDLPKIMAVALHEYWFACSNGAAFFHINVEDKGFLDNDYTRSMATPQGYADAHGWAYTLANGFADLIPCDARKKWICQLTKHEMIDVLTAFQCMALQWLVQASIEVKNKNFEFAFDLVHEATDALALHWTHTTWDSAWTDAMHNAEEDLGARVRSDLARKASLAAHVETHAMKAEIREFWMKNIPPSMSNDAAAAFLMRQFPLNPRTLSKYVSQFKNTAS